MLAWEIERQQYSTIISLYASVAPAKIHPDISKIEPEKPTRSKRRENKKKTSKKEMNVKKTIAVGNEDCASYFSRYWITYGKRESWKIQFKIKYVMKGNSENKSRRELIGQEKMVWDIEVNLFWYLWIDNCRVCRLIEMIFRPFLPRDKNPI